MRPAVLCVAISVLIGVAACGPSSNTVVTPDGAVTTTQSADGSVTTVKGPNGEVVEIGGGNGAAAQLPDFLPLYPGAKVTASVAVPNADNDKKGGNVAFDTKATVAEVIAFYKQKAQAQGLPETMNTSSADSTTFMAMKDQTMVQVIASKGSDGTNAMVSWTAPK